MKQPLTMALTLALRLTLCASAALSAHAACPSWPTAQRFVFNGDEASDVGTGLVWKRCSAGQTFSSNTCTGTATQMTHAQALAYAKSLNTLNSPTGWRLPSVKELSTLADRGCVQPPIDTTAFPNTPDVWFWSSTPYVGGTDYAWLVDFVYGDVGGEIRTNSLRVRLVRTPQ